MSERDAIAALLAWLPGPDGGWRLTAAGFLRDRRGRCPLAAYAGATAGVRPFVVGSTTNLYGPERFAAALGWPADAADAVALAADGLPSGRSGNAGHRPGLRRALLLACGVSERRDAGTTKGRVG